MKKIILTAVILVLLTIPAYALSLEDVMKSQREEFQVDEFESESRAYLDGIELDPDLDWQENLSVLVDTGTEELFGIIKKAVRSCVLMLGIVVFCSLSDGLFLSAGDSNNAVVNLAGTLAVSAVAVADVHSLLGLGMSSIETLTSFSNILLPVVAALTAATGAITGAAARQMAAVLFSGILINLVDQLLVPLIYGYIGANIAHAATGNDGLKRISALLKWTATTLLTVMLLIYVGYLTLSSIISGSADAATIKATKFAISTAVPVVGGIIADASESVLAAAGILRSSIGVFGMIAILGICLVPFLQLAVHYLAYKFIAAVTSTLGEGPVSALIENLSRVFGLILGMTGACALMLLVSLVSSVIVVTV